MKLEQLKHEVEELTPEEFKEFSDWFEHRMADLWDEQIEKDAKAGKLDFLVRETDADFDAGLCKPL